MAEIIRAFNVGGLDTGVQALAEARLKHVEKEAARIVGGTGTSGGVWTTKCEKTHGTGDIEKSATQFEALLLQQLFKSMWQTLPKGGLLSGSREEELFRDMLNENLAKEVSEKQSIGIKAIVMKEMEQRVSVVKKK